MVPPFEGFPNSVLTAMAYGKAVIASRIGGLGEIVSDGITGILCPVGDLNDWEKKIRYLWERPLECKKMGLLGRQQALAEYSETVAYKRYMEVYNSLMADA